MTEEELEKKIENVYRRASEETSQKLNEHMKRYERLDAERKASLSPEDYEDWRRRQYTTGQRWESMTNSLARDVLKADNEARDLINDYVPEAFADGYNYSCYQMAKGMGDSYVNGTFTLYDKQAVERLVRDNPDLLPQLNPNSKTAEDIRAGKIIRWNKEKINSEVTQGIIQGESIGKIANRMQNVVGMEERSAIRNARTATNGARNAGKEESFEDAEELGIEVLQMWVASVDDRTRYEHRQLDGQTVKTGEKFKVGDFEIAYPCDPTADPSMVYNCRCTIIPYLPKYSKEKPNAHQSVSQKDYEKWKEEQPYKSEKKEETKPATAYEKATNREEAKQLLHDVGFTQVRGSDQVSDRLLVENANQLAELNTRFGAVDNVVFNVRAFTGEQEKQMAYATTNNSLVLNSNYFKDTRLVRNVMGRELTPDEDGRLSSMPVSKEHYDTAILTHEYGHLLQSNLFEQTGLEKYTSENTYTSEYLDWTTDVANEIFGIAIENNPDKEPLELWKEQVSTYAEVNSQAFFAECFMNAYCGEPNEFGKAMNIWLERQGY